MTSRGKPTVTSFNGGEADSEFEARVDVEGYSARGSIVENWLPRVKGGMDKAPGTRYLGETPDSAFAILRPWRFSPSQAYVLELSANKLRIVAGDGYILCGTGDASLGSWSSPSPPSPPSPPSLPPALPPTSPPPPGESENPWDVIS